MNNNAQHIINEINTNEINKIKRVIKKLANKLFCRVLSESEIEEIMEELK